MSSLYISLILFEIFNALPVKCDFDCLIDENKGYDDLKNIYQCKDDQKCCIEFAQPSCCHTKPVLQIIREQLSIWGTLFAILFTVSLIVYCRKKDLHYIKYLKRCLINCCCGRRQNEINEETEVKSIAKDEADSRV